MTRRLPHVDWVGVEERAAQLGRRSIKATAKQQGIRLPSFPEIPSVAAVCVYPSLVAVASAALRGTGVRTASVATGFPAGQISLEAKLRDTEDA